MNGQSTDDTEWYIEGTVDRGSSTGFREQTVMRSGEYDAETRAEAEKMWKEDHREEHGLTAEGFEVLRVRCVQPDINGSGGGR